MTGKLISFIRRKIFRIDKYRWDHQYAKGQWDSLRTDEMERFLVARDLLTKYVAGGNVLEIGCGEAVFFNLLSDVEYTFFEGIDLSQVAISRIGEFSRAHFAAADMENYTPLHAPFSVIVLNEVLYYSKNPEQLLKRYLRFLTTDGIFLIGMHDSAKSQAIWSGMKTFLQELDAVKIEQHAKTWHYRVFTSLNFSTPK